MRCSLHVVLTILLTAFVMPCEVRGQDGAVGEMLSAEQSVTVVRADGKEVAVKQGLALFAGDRIITGDEGRAAFSLSQGSRFQLGASSEVAIDELSEAEMNESPPVLRLAVGVLRSFISGLTGESARPVVDTPTATIGVRGTEFDTVVSLDMATVVAVDEGSVAVDWEDRQTVVDHGKMVQSLPEAAPALMPATPRQQRNWMRWRQDRRKALPKKLPGMISHYRRRFDRVSKRYTGYQDKVRQVCDHVSDQIEAVRKARAERNRAVFRREMRQLKIRQRSFRKVVRHLRRKTNKVRAITRHCHQLEGFVSLHKNRFSPRDLAAIRSDITAITRQGMHLKTVSRETFSTVRQTARSVKIFLEKDLGQKRRPRE